MSVASNEENDDDDDDDDDEWEDMSHDDSATLDGAADEETKEATKQIDVDVPDKNNKLSFLLHDECVAIIGD